MNRHCSTLWAALLAAGCAATTPKDSANSPEWRIVYNVWIDVEADNYDVFIMDLDGGNARNLTNHPAVDWAYSARDGRVYVVSDRDDEKRKYHLYAMDPGTGNLEMLTRFRVRDSWVGTHGGRLLVATDEASSAEIVEIDEASGQVLRRLTRDEHRDNDPAYSPDGRQMAWRSYRSGLDEIWVMDLASGDSRQLTRYPADDPGKDEYGYHAGPPRWQGDWISFCSKRGGNTSIYRVRSDGSDLQQLTHGSGDECWHDWSPDGRWLVYDASDPVGGYDIYLRDLQTGQDRRLTNSPWVEQAPVFIRVDGSRDRG